MNHKIMNVYHEVKYKKRKAENRKYLLKTITRNVTYQMSNYRKLDIEETW